MNKRLRLYGIVLALALAGRAQNAGLSGPSETFSIRGTVMNETDGMPIPRAEVYIGWPQDKAALNAEIADEQGRFHFAGLAPGKYVILVGKKGFIERPYGWKDGYVIGVAVGADQKEPNVILKLSPESSISGSVYGERDTPIREAQISLYRSDLVNGLRHTVVVKDTTSDAKGRYEFGHLPPGHYLLAEVKAETEFTGYVKSALQFATVMHRSSGAGNKSEDAPPAVLPDELDVVYPVTFFPDTLNPERAQPVLLHAGEKFQADFQLHAERATHVTIPSGVNAGFRVRTFEDQELDVDPMPIAAETAQGQTVAVAPGRYSVQIQSCWTEGCQLGDSRLDLTADATIESHQIQNPQVTISGIVKTQDGRPFPANTTIAFVPEHSVSESNIIRLRTDESGKASASAVMAPGRYTVEMDNRDFWIKSLIVSGARMRGNILEKSSPGPLQFAMIVVKGGSAVEGKVMNAGEPFAGAMVLLVPADSEHNPEFRRDESDSDGTFSLQVVPPGSYIVLALEHGWGMEWAKPEVLKPYLAKGKRITISSGKIEAITVELQ